MPDVKDADDLFALLYAKDDSVRIVDVVSKIDAQCFAFTRSAATVWHRVQ
jgi:hypothetical protein